MYFYDRKRSFCLSFSIKDRRLSGVVNVFQISSPMDTGLCACAISTNISSTGSNKFIKDNISFVLMDIFFLLSYQLMFCFWCFY